MGLFDKLFKKKANAPELNNSSSAIKQKNEPSTMSVTVKLERVKSDPAGEIGRIDFGSVSGELGCYLNYTPKKLYPPSERQYEYARDLGIVLPDGITNIDISHMIDRATGEDSKESPSPALVSLATGFGCQFSAYIGESGLLRSIVSQSKPRDLAAFYVYAVRQNVRGQKLGDMLADPEVAALYIFADRAIGDPALLKSIQGREAVDFLKPHKASSAYKAAAAFLAGGGGS